MAATNKQHQSRNLQISPGEEDIVARIMRKTRINKSRKKPLPEKEGSQIPSWGDSNKGIQSWGEEGGEEEGEEEGPAGSAEKETAEGPAEEKKAGRKLNISRIIEAAEKSGSKDLKSKEASMKRLQMLYRVINGEAAITVVGIIVTLIIMHCQLIFGNFLNLPFVPKLEWWEKGLLAIVDFNLLMWSLLQLALFAIIALAIYYATHKIEALKSIFEEKGPLSGFYDLIKSVFGGGDANP